jgi:hypothetical protein
MKSRDGNAEERVLQRMPGAPGPDSGTWETTNLNDRKTREGLRLASPNFYAAALSATVRTRNRFI